MSFPVTCLSCKQSFHNVASFDAHVPRCPEPPRSGAFSPIPTTSSEGVKYDSGKLQYALLPPDAMDEVVAVFTYGATKYAARNWEKGMAWGRNLSASLRHVFAWMSGEDRDPETNIHHLAHAITDLLFLLAYQLRGVGQDDRGPKVSLTRREVTT